jgi:hypothetical protein
MIAAHKKHHISYYAVVGLIQLVGLILIIWAGGNKQIQMMYVVLMTLLYVAWGLVHHKIHHDLHAKVVIEYVLMGSLGIAIMYFLLQ